MDAEFDAGPAGPINGDDRSNRARQIIQRPKEFDQNEEKYKMNRKKRTAIIFNHNKFKPGSHIDNHQLEDRPGTENDVKRLEDVLRNVHFDVSVYEDYTRSQIFEDVIENLKKKDFSDEDCLAIFVLTHGHGEKIAAYDYLYEPDELWRFFTGNHCKTLAGKPKLIFINACRGRGRDYGVEFSDLAIDGPEIPCETIYKIPCMADMLVAYSTTKDYYSHRDPKEGAWFIQCLCNNLSDDEILKKDLKQILTITSRQVASMVNKLQTTQVPTIVSTLIRDVYFKEQE